MASATGMLSITSSVKPDASTCALSAAIRSTDQTAPTGMSSSVPTIPRTPGIWAICHSFTLSASPNQRHVMRMI